MTKTLIEAHFSSEIQKEIEAKIQTELRRVEFGMENPDPVLHGMAVGERRAYQSFLRFKEILLTEEGGKSPYGHKSNIR